MQQLFTEPATRLARARDDLRRGLPVVVEGDNRCFLALALERLDGQLLAAFDALGNPADDRLLITGQRAEILRIGSKGRRVVSLSRPHDPLDSQPHLSLLALADPARDADLFLRGPFNRLEQDDRTLERGVITLLKSARLLPGALVRPLDQAPEGALCVDAQDILASAPGQAAGLDIVARARLPVAAAPDSQLIAFRSRDGGMEHMALVIGSWQADHIPLVRLHSECFTGDLLGSLKCDCGTQLTSAIARIRDGGGGVLLYLAQEGRGIGLMSKLRAYSLQDQGFDTVDANLRLGFENDERDFAPAAAMLKLLDIDRVQLLTNNPEKLAGLKAHGIRVAGRIAHSFPSNPHNHQYLATKRDRSGHLIADLPPAADDPDQQG